MQRRRRQVLSLEAQSHTRQLEAHTVQLVRRSRDHPPDQVWLVLRHVCLVQLVRIQERPENQERQQRNVRHVPLVTFLLRVQPGVDSVPLRVQGVRTNQRRVRRRQIVCVPHARHVQTLQMVPLLSLGVQEHPDRARVRTVVTLGTFTTAPRVHRRARNVPPEITRLQGHPRVHRARQRADRENTYRQRVQPHQTLDVLRAQRHVVQVER